nr:non-homologous end-joining DNA ligase [Marinithermofilum abyssi]
MDRLNKRRVLVEGREILISNPDKILYPDVPLTKWDWILHMTRLAPYILPYCRNRYLTTIRYPDGVNGKFFYQKNIPEHAPDWIPTAKNGDIVYILLNDVPTLVYLANLACLEFHVSFDRADNPGCPTELVFDLDPSVEGFDAVMEVALWTKEVLDQMGLTSVVKTSGATGLQIYVPISPQYSFEETRMINRFIARYLAEKHPRRITLERSVKQRGDKVYFDYLQHWRGKSLTAPYSTRARAHATVSTPLQWEELRPGLQPEQFTLETIHSRLEQWGDLFAPVSRPNTRHSLKEILRFVRQQG